MSPPPVHVWLIWSIGLPVVIILNEIIKRQEIKMEGRYQRRQRLEFQTKLGINSPFWEDIEFTFVIILIDRDFHILLDFVSPVIRCFLVPTLSSRPSISTYYFQKQTKSFLSNSVHVIKCDSFHSIIRLSNMILHFNVKHWNQKCHSLMEYATCFPFVNIAGTTTLTIKLSIIFT